MSTNTGRGHRVGAAKATVRVRMTPPTYRQGVAAGRVAAFDEAERAVLDAFPPAMSAGAFAIRGRILAAIHALRGVVP